MRIVPQGAAPLKRRAVVMVLAAGLVATGLFAMSDTHLLNARSLANELVRCVTDGSAPQPQPDLARRYRERVGGEPVATPSRDVGIAAVLSPRDYLPRDYLPRDYLPRDYLPRDYLPRDNLPRDNLPRGYLAGGPASAAQAPRRVVVAVLDAGVDADHPDLDAAMVLPGADLLNPCGDGRTDVTGHGTAVAGVLASESYGASPQVAILPVRVSLATGRHYRWVSALAIAWSARAGADVINMSYAHPSTHTSVLERWAVDYARRRGAVLVAAAGNDADRPVGYPAAAHGVLAVTATDAAGELAPYAARTSVVDIAAPGSRVLTLGGQGGFRAASGTSLAAPMVSAAIAQTLAANPELTPQEALDVVLAQTVVGAHGFPQLAGAGLGAALAR